MTEQRFQLAEKLRTYISKYGINDFNEEHLQKVGLTLEELKENFTDRKDIVKAILVNEGDTLKKRLLISSLTINIISIAFPDIFEEHMQMRSDFIYEKIKINIEKGMEQGMYKKDISSEMIARMYIAKLNDIHNPDIYPPEGFTFATIFNNLIDGVIKNITNEEGRRYYKQRKQLYSILNFR